MLDAKLPRRSAMLTVLAVIAFLSPGLANAQQLTPGAATNGFVGERLAAVFREHCFDCHGEGAREGSLALDDLLAATDSEETRRRWWSVLKNVRTGLMPPKNESRLGPVDRSQLLHWLREKGLRIDPRNPDPGQVVLRRMNRTEYRNTIRDLMGVEFNSAVEFPPDDTGHGFDTVGDAMSVSPLLMEKYLQAAESIVLEAVPLTHRVPKEIFVAGDQLRARDHRQTAESISFYTAVELESSFQVETGADYEMFFDWEVDGNFDFDPGRCRVILHLDEEPLIDCEHGWSSSEKGQDRFSRRLAAGDHKLRLALKPLVAESLKMNDIRFEVKQLKIVGPTDPALWTTPAGYERFFSLPEPPRDVAARTAYARDILKRFADRAFRRPIDSNTLDNLVAIAARDFGLPAQTFEHGIARAMVAVLASPRFIFRAEQPLPSDAGQRFPRIDEFSLASRLAYFLWSTMPDARLTRLAAAGRLRSELRSEVERLVQDKRFDALCENFVGQWLQTRDVESVSIDPLEALDARDEYDELRDWLRERFDDDRSQWERDDHEASLQVRLNRYRELRALRDSLNGDLRRDLRRETEELFRYVASQDRSLLELIDGHYSFLNHRLAKYYGIDDVVGDELRRVDLPDGSPRGGVLTQGSFLIVSSNPTRTSPVKRGLFILENFLGTPTAPPPAMVPELEQASRLFADRKPTLREVLELHRKDALCASCHDRFDPLGLALENFTAMGTWRDVEVGLPIETAGELITGEVFATVQQLKQVLAGPRRSDFYHCFAGKLLTYAIGRGVDYYDEEAIEGIVSELESHDGRFSAALLGVIDSAPFQRMRAP